MMILKQIFLHTAEMSITAGIVILVVLCLRLLLKKAPKKYSYLLWGIVGFRLICPAAPESPISIFSGIYEKMQEPIQRATLQYIPENRLSKGILAEDNIREVENFLLQRTPRANTIMESENVLNAAIENGNTLNTASENGEALNAMAENVAATGTAVGETVQQGTDLLLVLAIVWFAGIIVLLLYSIISYIWVKKQMDCSVLLQDNVYQSDKIHSPFILGIYKPKIYIPFGLGEDTLAYVLTHERYHLKRRDHIIKPLAYFILLLHWMNPLCWLSFILMSRDMEMSCDEKVLSIMENSKKAYSNSLLSFAVSPRFPSPSPLCFGETSVETRIKNILGWKKPAAWITVLAVCICLAAVGACGTDPKEQEKALWEQGYRMTEIIYDGFTYSAMLQSSHEKIDSAAIGEVDAMYYDITADGILMKGRPMTGIINWENAGGAEKIRLTEENFDNYFRISTGEEWITVDQELASYLRENCEEAYMSVTDQVFYYMLQLENGEIYGTYGLLDKEGEEDNSFIQMVFRLKPLSAVTCTAVSDGLESYCEAMYFPQEQSTYNFDFLSSAIIWDKGELKLSIGWESETLTVWEEYYECPALNEWVCKKESYELAKDKDGIFTLPVQRRNNIADEYAIYYFSDGTEKYIFKVYYPLEHVTLEEMVGRETPVVNNVALDNWKVTLQENGYKEAVYYGVNAGEENSFVEDSVKAQNILEEAAKLYNVTAKEMDAAIIEAIVEQNKSPYGEEYFRCASYALLGLESRMGDPFPVSGVLFEQASLNMMALYQEYDFADGRLIEKAGSHAPFSIGFMTREENREFDLDTYTFVKPASGDEYEEYVYQIFPEEIQGEALDNEKYLLSQKQDCYAQAVQHFNIDTYRAVEKLFEIVMSSPLESSDPYDYIQEHSQEYQELLYYGDYTLRYILNEFLSGIQTGLKANLMGIALDDLLGEEAPERRANDGYKYFMAFKEEAGELLSLHGSEYMKKYTPKAWMLIEEMAGE